MAFLGGVLVALGALLCAFAFLAAFTPFGLLAPLLGVVLVGAGTRVLTSRRPPPPAPPPLPPPPGSDRPG